VSRWLFIGQFAASTGFCIYSILVENWVFIATNGLLAIEALVGLSIVRIHRRREARVSQAPSASPHGGSLSRALGSLPTGEPSPRSASAR
jgi:hypothetical protein